MQSRKTYERASEQEELRGASANGSALATPVPDGWRYFDPSGTLQGPFAEDQMRAWAGTLGPGCMVVAPMQGEARALGGIARLATALPMGNAAPVVSEAYVDRATDTIPLVPMGQPQSEHTAPVMATAITAPGSAPAEYRPRKRLMADLRNQPGLRRSKAHFHSRWPDHFLSEGILLGGCGCCHVIGNFDNPPAQCCGEQNICLTTQQICLCVECKASCCSNTRPLFPCICCCEDTPCWAYCDGTSDGTYEDLFPCCLCSAPCCMGQLVEPVSLAECKTETCCLTTVLGHPPRHGGQISDEVGHPVLYNVCGVTFFPEPALCKPVRENGILGPFIYKMHHFAKTGSGQT
jgi:hypothetical protein